MADLTVRIEAALVSDDACHDLRLLARQLVTEGHAKTLLNDAFLNALSGFPTNARSSYPYRLELGETLQLLALWTSVHHAQWPEPWYSGQGTEGFANHKTEAEVAAAEDWLRNELASRSQP